MTTYNPYAYQGYELTSSKVKATSNQSAVYTIPAYNNPAKKDLHIVKSAASAKVRLSNGQLYKWIFCLMVILLFVTSFYLVRASAVTPMNHLGTIEEEIIVVGSGDTLWKIASIHYEHIPDKAFAVYLIKERNELQSDLIKPGEQLILPKHRATIFSYQ